MSCYHPLKAFRTPSGVVFQELSRHDIIGDIELPCGQCIGCRMRRATDWALRCMHEAASHKENCFITLTYARDNLPADSSLDHRDFQLFLKRVRKHFAPIAVRFYMCGEYGPLNRRPHYHACLFGLEFREDRKLSGRSASGVKFFNSPLLERLWGYGRVSVQDLTVETAGYCARYIMKKVLGEAAKTAYETIDDDGVIVKRKPEYAAMSLKPGIGAAWFEKYCKDVYPHDFVISGGRKQRPPKYYDRLLKRSGSLQLDDIEFARQIAAGQCSADNTPERRLVREIVHKARCSTLMRGLE